MSIPELTQALSTEPGNWERRLSLVQALVAEGKHEEAVEVVNQGEAIPHEAAPWLAAAKTYAAVGAIEQAGSLVATALEIDPEFEPAKAYRKELTLLAPQVAVALTADDLEEDTAVDAARGASVEEAVPLLRKSGEGATATPISLPKVSFSSHEMEALKEAEEAVNRQRATTRRRDKFNSVTITVLIHVAIFLGLTLVVTQDPPRVPPQIVASSATQEQQEVIENVKMDKPTLEPTTAVNSSVADIISVSATSSFSVSSVDVPVADVAMEMGMQFNPSMSLGMTTATKSKMMFGQTMEMEGEVLGVILDVSGSMAEFLPAVVREVDKNFKDSPVVYVRNMLLSQDNREGEARLIIPEEVVPYDPVYKTHTPYWFLWHDLPRKAPQRYVDRLIETFKTRPNQFITTGKGWDGSSLIVATDFLMEEKIDALYIFSDFEDFVDEDIAAEIGQKLGRRKIRTYVQPAEQSTEFLDVMTKKIANKTLGRQMPSLVSLLRGSEETEVTSLMPQKRQDDVAALANINVKLATPRETITGDPFYGFKPAKEWTEIHRLSEPEYDAVFYGPEARVEIFLKNAEGKYIQNPISFFYHAWKEVPEHPDPRFRWRPRKFLRVEEPPSFDGKEIIWKMVLEDEYKFRVHLYLGRKGMNATYVADVHENNNDSSWIGFRVPALAVENKDMYYGFDFPPEGLKLDQVREAVKANEVIFNLPRAERERFIKGWAVGGFDMGYNTRKYNELIRAMPGGIRDVVVQGPSFGTRKFHARTTSGKIFLSGGAGRADIEPWESYWFSLNRGREDRTKFTKTEAIEIQIE
jgi:hypothetical protein